MDRGLTVVERCAFAICLALTVCSVSATVNSRWMYRHETIASQQAIVERQPFLSDGQPVDLPEFRGRILMPLLLHGSQAAFGGSIEQSFVAWRVLSAWLLFLLVLSVPPAPWYWSALAGGLFAYLLILSFNHVSEQPTDFPDVGFTLGFCVFALRGSWNRLVLLTGLAALNRESAAFAGIVWASVHAFAAATPRGRAREVLKGIALSAAAYTVVTITRYAFRVPEEGDWLQTLAILRLPDLIAGFLRDPSVFGWPVLFAAAAAPLGWANYRLSGVRTAAENGLVWSGILVLIVTAIFGAADEIRVFLPPFTILAFSIVHVGRRQLGVRSGAATGPAVIPHP